MNGQADPPETVDAPAGHESSRRLVTDWRFVTPPVAGIVLAVSLGREIPALLLAVVAVVLGAAVLAAVHHAEVVAHRAGEPLGSLLLAVAVTVIEVGLIVTLMISGGTGTESLARDTVFAAVSPRLSPRPTPPDATASRSASTSRSAPPWPASA